MLYKVEISKHYKKELLIRLPLSWNRILLKRGRKRIEKEKKKFQVLTTDVVQTLQFKRDRLQMTSES